MSNKQTENYGSRFGDKAHKAEDESIRKCAGAMNTKGMKRGTSTKVVNGRTIMTHEDE